MSWAAAPSGVRADGSPTRAWDRTKEHARDADGQPVCGAKSRQTLGVESDGWAAAVKIGLACARCVRGIG